MFSALSSPHGGRKKNLDSARFQRHVKSRCLPATKPLPQRKEIISLSSWRYIKDGVPKPKGHPEDHVQYFLNLGSNMMWLWQ